MEKTLKNGEWLSDDHIELAQEVLKKQFPHVDGLQSPLLAQNDGFVPVEGEGNYCTLRLFIVIIFIYIPVNLEGIQIHHINGNHWITSCSFGREVTVYDSTFVGGDLSSSLTHQLSSIYRALVIHEIDGEEVDPHLKVFIPPVQQQSGLSA